MPKHYSKIHALLQTIVLVTLITISAPIAYGDDQPSYEAEVPVASRDALELNKAFATALQQILEKATASDTPAGKNPEITAFIRKQLPHASSMVQSYSYSKHITDKGVQQLVVQINFYQENIEQILGQLPGQEHQDAMYTDDAASAKPTIPVAASATGINSKPASDIVYPTATTTPVGSSSTATDLNNTESQPSAATPTLPASSAITMKINGINNLEQNMEAVNYLQSLSPKLKTELLDVTPTSITVGITIDGGKTALMNLLNAQKKLSKDNTPPPPKPVDVPSATDAETPATPPPENNADLTYNWTSPPKPPAPPSPATQP